MSEPVNEVTEEVQEPIVDGQEESTEPAADEQAEEKVEETKNEEKQEEPKNHFQRRQERLLKERAEYKAKVELYERMITQQQQPQQPAAVEGRPSRAAFDDDESYVDALTTWKVDQKLANVKQEINQHRAQEDTQSSWATKVTEARSAYADYESVMEDAEDVPIQPHVAEAIQGSEVGADVAYYLAKHTDIVDKINRLSPMAAAREIGKIESKIEAEKSKSKTAPVSKAPAPINPPRASTSAGLKSLESMSMDEFAKFMNKRDAERRKR